MDIETIEKSLSKILTNNQENINLNLEDISKLNNIKTLINHITIIKDIKSKKQNLKQNLKNFHKKQKLLEYKKLIDITTELEKTLKAFKKKYITLKESIKTACSQYPDFHPENLLNQIFKFLIPINNVMCIARNTSFNIWGFQGKKKDRFNVEELFLLLEDIHNYYDDNFELVKLGNYDREIIGKNLNLELEGRSVYSVGFIIPQKKDIIETNVFFLFFVDDGDCEVVEDYFENEIFLGFNKNVFQKLMKIFINLRLKNLTEEIFLNNIPKVYHLFNYYIVELFLFEMKRNADLNYFLIDEKKFDFFDYKFFKIKKFDFYVYVKIKKNNKDDSTKYLEKWLNDYFQNFFGFFQENFLKINYSKIKKDFVFYLNKHRKVLSFEYKSKTCSEIFSYDKFEYLKDLDHYIKNENFLNILKNKIFLEKFTEDNIYKNSFYFQSLKIYIRPLFILRNEKNIKNHFILEIQDQKTMKSENSNLPNYHVTIPFQNYKKESILEINPKIKEIKSKELKNKDSIKKIINQMKVQVDSEIEKINSMTNLDLEIDKSLEDFGTKNFHNTIFSEYVNKSKLLRYKSMADNKITKNNIKKQRKKSLMCNLINIDQINLQLEKKNLFEKFVNEENLINYKTNFLKITSLQKKFNSIHSMFTLTNLTKNFLLDEKKFHKFCQKIEKLYNKRKNPYHNFDHALTTLNGCFYIIKKSEASNYFEITGLLSLLFSALMHDIDHPGNNNDFEINNLSELARRYNNQHVLENHHCFVTFEILRQDEFQFFKNMERDCFLNFRKISIELILRTDPKIHFEMLKKFISLSKSQEKFEFRENVNFENFIILGGNIMHAADLHGPVKLAEESDVWSCKIHEEFLEQLKHEEEQGLPVTSFFADIKDDRKNILNQMFFIEKIVKPLWVSLDDFLGGNFVKEIENIDNNLRNCENKLNEVLERE